MNRNSEDIWRDLFYIELRDDGKMPKHQWGGYDQDFDDAEHVFTFDELTPGRRYGYIGHTRFELGIIDIDFYKDEAPPPADVTFLNSNAVIKTPSGGIHVLFLQAVDDHPDRDDDKELRVDPTLNDWIDLKGEVNKGHAVAPYNTDYEIAKHGTIPIVSKDEIERVVQFKDEGVVQYVKSGPTWTGDSPYDTVYNLLDRENYPVGSRVEHPFHGSSTDSNFKVDKNETTFRCYRHRTTGNLIHLVGMKHGEIECGEWDHNDIDYDKLEEIAEIDVKPGWEMPEDELDDAIEQARQEGIWS